MTGISDFIRGDTKTITLVLKDKDGNPIDITGCSVWFTLKRDIYEDDSQASLQKIVTDHIDPTNGTTAIVLTHADTNSLIGSYYYDIQLVDTNGNVTTLIYGRLKVLPDVTRSV